MSVISRAVALLFSSDSIARSCQELHIRMNSGRDGPIAARSVLRLMQEKGFIENECSPASGAVEDFDREVIVGPVPRF